MTLSSEIITNQKKSKKLVFVSGYFNILHPGHQRLLRFASECGDYLIAGVLPDDDEGGAFIPAKLRLEALEANTWVDSAFILEDKLETYLEKIKPDIIVKGKEHENQFNLEENLIKKYGGKLIFASGDVNFSSLDLLQNEYSLLKLHEEIPYDYLERHKISEKNLFELINQIKELDLFVIGDLIVDEYVSCSPLGMSQEDPTLVVSPQAKKKFIGGAAIVAAHARSLGAQTHFISTIGLDPIGNFAKKELKKYDVKTFLLEDDSRPTSYKQRFQVNNKTLLRVNELKQHDISKEFQEKVFDQLSSLCQPSKLLVFSDFNYGMLPQGLVNKITSHCLQKKIMMVADSQSSSQLGNVARFKHMTLLTPTEREARLAVQDQGSGLVVLAEKLKKKSKAKNIFLTLGADGLLIHAPKEPKQNWQTDKLPSLNSKPLDVSGAGDSLLITSAMIKALHGTIWESAFLGSLAASCQVGRVGNKPLLLEDLISKLKYSKRHYLQ